ncbi:hypothetical protein [Tenacibaculum maritimum]|uniref:hypothetical protein n=1 Tax=Tenacibaculum maritimum TaxID=107401 RepID=UPI00132FAEE5|nr:hypothetical protein [Tenacibaculum maritimum]
MGENLEFMDTSAHEIGHTILKAYGGTFYSYGHKGSGLPNKFGTNLIKPLC